MNVSSLQEEEDQRYHDDDGRRPSMVTKARKENRPIYYFGFGSNMLRSKIEDRSFCGTGITVLSYEPAYVKGYRLAFNMRGFPPLEPAMASLEDVIEEEGEEDIVVSADGNGPRMKITKPLYAYSKPECHGALVQLSPQDYDKVMESEGIRRKDEVGVGIPPGYEEIVVTVIPYDKTKEPVQAIALKARPEAKIPIPHDAAPSERYMNILREGAQSLPLKQEYQDFLQEHPTAAPTSPILKLLAFGNMIVGVTLAEKFKCYNAMMWYNHILFKVHYIPKPPQRIQQQPCSSTVSTPSPSSSSIVSSSGTNSSPTTTKTSSFGTMIKQTTSHVVIGIMFLPGFFVGTTLMGFYYIFPSYQPPFLKRILDLMIRQKKNDNTNGDKNLIQSKNDETDDTMSQLPMD